MAAVVFATVSTTASRADLLADNALVARFAAGSGVGSNEAAAAALRLLAAHAYNPDIVGTIDKLRRGPIDAGSIDGVPVALTFGEYWLQHEIHAGLINLDEDNRPSADQKARLQALTRDAQNARQQVMRLAPSPARARLARHMRALELQARSVVDEVGAMRDAAALIEQTLAGPERDGRAFALALHAWAFASQHLPAGEATRRLDGWFTRARAVWPDSDPDLGDAAVDVADRAATESRGDVARRTLLFLASQPRTLPDPLFGVATAQELAEMADDVHDMSLSASFRFRFFRGLLTASAIEPSARRTMLDAYTPLDLDQPEATVAALGQALAETQDQAPDAGIAAAMEGDLAILLGRQGRPGEVEIGDFASLGSEDARKEAAEAGLGDLASLLKDAESKDVEDAPLDSLALFSRAADLSKRGSGAPALDRVRARMGVIRELDRAGLQGDAFKRLEQFGPDIAGDKTLPPAEKMWFFGQAADWAAARGRFEVARYRSLLRDLPVDEEWEAFGKLMDAGGPTDDVQTRFVGAVRLAGEASNPGQLRRSLDRYVPLYGGWLSKPEHQDQTALFARPYARALRLLGQAPMADAVWQAQDLPYPVFCQIMVAAGDRRLAAPQASCPPATGHVLDVEPAERDRLAAADPGEPAVAAGDKAVCDALEAANKDAAQVPLDRTRLRLWLVLDAVRQSGRPTACATAAGSGLGSHGPVAALAQTYEGVAPKLSLALYGEAVERSTNVFAAVDAVDAALTAGQVDTAAALMRKARTTSSDGLPLMHLFSMWEWGHDKTTALTQAQFPDEASILQAIDGLGDGVGSDRFDAVDAGLAAAPAALYRSESGAWSDAFEQQLRARANPRNDSTAALLAAAWAALADAWLIDAHVGTEEAGPLYGKAHALLQSVVARDDLPFALKIVLLDDLRFFVGRETDQPGTVPTPEGCQSMALFTFGPFANPERTTNKSCVTRLFATWAADLRAFETSPDENAEAADAHRGQLLERLQGILDAFGAAALTRLPPDAAPLLIDLSKARRPPGQQADVSAALRLAAQQAGPTAGPDALHEAWIAASRALHRSLSEDVAPGQIEALARQSEAAWRVYAASPLSAAPARPATGAAAPRPDWAAVQQALAPDEAIVVYLTDICDAAVVVRHDGTTIVPLPRDAETLAGEARDFRSTVAPSADAAQVDVALGHRLYADLFAPLDAGLVGVKTLYLDVPAALAALPFPALVRDAPARPRWSTADTWTPDWLNRHFDLAFIVDPGVVALARTSGPSERAPRVLAAGDPLLSDKPPADTKVDAILAASGPTRADMVRTSFEALPGAAAEIDDLAALLPGQTTVMRGAAFTNSGLMAAITPTVTHILLATHAAASPDSGAALLVTSPQGGRDDGIMDAAAVKVLPLDAELVVLSACQTGAATTGQSIFGALASSFQVAGARRIVATLWPVVSEAEEAVTVRTMKGVLQDHLPPVAALANAMRAVAEGQAGIAARHPGSWSSFIVIGEP